MKIPRVIKMFLTFTVVYAVVFIICCFVVGDFNVMAWRVNDSDSSGASARALLIFVVLGLGSTLAYALWSFFIDRGDR